MEERWREFGLLGEGNWTKQTEFRGSNSHMGVKPEMEGEDLATSLNELKFAVGSVDLTIPPVDRSG